MGGNLFSLDESMLEGIKSVRICRSAPHLPSSSTSFSLETVASYVLELEVEVGERRYSSITLREVPSFLLEAFRDLRSRGLEVEGLFRKEGNWNRLKNISPVYFGCVGIPRDCTVHDICSMIKRFFRELKTPLFAHLETKLVDIALVCEGEMRRRRLLDAVLMLPPSHLGTLAYLFRQLKYFGDHHEGHHMTAENLARVFAPTLFRDGCLSMGNKKKKKIPQKPLYSAIRDDTELKITIVTELIENAAKVGVPQDCYVFSRRPSDLNFGKAQARKVNSSAGTSVRSSSAKPFTRNSFPRPATFVAGDASTMTKESKMEKAKRKGREGRRSSSTVREIFSSISSMSTKVLRRAVSPTRMLGRRTSADVSVANRVPSVERLPHRPDKTSALLIERLKEDRQNRVDFENEEEEEEQFKTMTFENEEDQQVDQKGYRRDGMDETLLVPGAVNEANTSAVSERRSRRESPRKHLTANSRVKPVGDPLIDGNWWPASPAFESPQMSTKRLSDVLVKRKESEEKKERKLRDSKIVKRNSSKSNAEALDANHIALSLLEDYDGSAMGVDRRRRHTAPLKLTSVLKRNQPNTVGTGLKNMQIRVRDRRALTLSLSFRSNNEGERGRRCDKMKRRSESLGGDESSDRSSLGSDEENDVTNVTKMVDAASILEQKNFESRQRRAKRKKMKEKLSDAGEKKKLVEPTEVPRESLTGSLLDDVTNALKRLERERQPVVDNSGQCASLFTSSPTNLKPSSAVPVYTRTETKVLPPPDVPATMTTPVTSPVSARCSPKKTNAVVPMDNGAVFKTPLSTARIFSGKNHVIEPQASVNCSAYESAFKVPFASCKKSPPKARMIGEHRQVGASVSVATTAHDEVINDDAFAHSDLYKNQILHKESDNLCADSQFAVNARPSVAFIKSNNRGMVKQRVNQFAQLETQKLFESFSSRSSQNSLHIAGAPIYEVMKPSAPPVTHGLRPAERRLTMSPPSSCSSLLSHTKASEVSSASSSPRFSPQSSYQRGCTPVPRVTSSTPLGACRSGSPSPRESPIFTPLSRHKTKQ